MKIVGNGMTRFFIKLLKLNAKLARYIAKYLPFITKPVDSSHPTFISAEQHVPFKELYYQHTLNTSDKWAHYFDVYDDFFKRYIGTNPQVLEIGVQNGGSLQILSQYLQNARIYGVDIDPNVVNLRLEENITVFNFDITDKQAITKNFKNSAFDIIIDDGSHICYDIITTFQLLFSMLKPGGVYLIEDLHTSYWNSHGGSYLGKDSAIEFFKKFADLLHFYHINDDQFDKNLSKSDVYTFQWLQSISFHDSVVVIHKRLTPRYSPYKRVIVGKLEPVATVIALAKKEGWYHSIH